MMQFFYRLHRFYAISIVFLFLRKAFIANYVNFLRLYRWIRFFMLLNYPLFDSRLSRFIS